MDKKAMSKHMKAITSRLSKFEVIFFGNQCILNEPVEQWPKVTQSSPLNLLCHCPNRYWLGFPIAKAKAYVELRKPYCLNSLDQDTLRDRRRVYDLLKEQRIPIPENVYANRDRYNGVDPKDLVIVEADDYIEVNGTTIHKPFVEKPVNAEDHNIHIYYPMSAGGGSKRLFRKVGDRSSEFYPEINEIRREGSYIYEAFVETQGTDVKVYTVGPDYGHAEARKSPTLDGKVNRNTEGKEIRYPVILSQEEIDYARKITLAFQQCVCGFDILRVHGRSFVCDVNGWSFVKNNRKYIEDCAQLLQEFIQAALKPGQNMVKSPAVLPVPHGNETPYNRNLMDMQLGSRINSVPMTSSNGNQRFTNQGKHLEELRCVITIARHGDRTPKQKMKMKTSFQHYLDFYDKYSPGHRQDLKIKGKMELKQFLATTVDLIESLGPDEKDHDSLSKLHQIRHVLERWEISGINRKLQLKPLQRDDIPPSEQEPHNGGIGNGTTNAAKIKGRSLLLILKWGGELTKLGEEQAMELGGSFRRTLYPDAGRGGLLRLHSTFRHDLKIRTSDEGRVMKTAASFAKGFLELEGELTPILVSLVHKVNSTTSSFAMLDRSGNKDVTKDMDRSKEFMSRIMGLDTTLSRDHIDTIVPAGQESVREAMLWLGNPVKKLHRMRTLISEIVEQLYIMSLNCPLAKVNNRETAQKGEDQGVTGTKDCTNSMGSMSSLAEVMAGRGSETQMPAGGETLFLMLERWHKLHIELLKEGHGFDITKIPDVHDNIRYDCLHNTHMGLKGLEELYDLAKNLADCIVPQEYGITVRYLKNQRDKLIIGSKMCSALLEKIKVDLIVARSNNEADMRFRLDVRHMEDLPINSLGRRVRTRLYFTSESHLHTLLNVLRFPIGGHPPAVTEEAQRMLGRTKELCYLTSFVIRVFENVEKEDSDPARFWVEILFSPGVANHTLLAGDHLHAEPLVPLQTNLTCAELEAILDAAIALAAKEHIGEMAAGSDAKLLKRYLGDQIKGPGSSNRKEVQDEKNILPPHGNNHRKKAFWTGLGAGVGISLAIPAAFAINWALRRHR